MPTPFSISAFTVRGYSIAEDVVGVNTLVQSPLVVAGRPSSAWEDYNYQSAASIILWGGVGFKTFPHQAGTVFLKSLAGLDGSAELISELSQNPIVRATF